MTTTHPIAPHIVRAAGAADFLSMVPHLVGCHPRDSVVLVPFGGSRSQGGMRIDLPPEGLSPDECSELAAAVLGSFARLPLADRVAVVVYTDDAFRGPEGRIARAGFVDALLRCIDAAEYGLVDALCVASDGWGSYIEPDAPYAARPLDDIAAERVAWPGSGEPLADQHAGAELPPSDLVERERVGRWLRENRLAPTSPVFPEMIESFVLDDPELLDADGLAQLIQLLDLPLSRDIALTQWAGDLAEGRAIWAWQLAWSRGERRPHEGALRLAGEGRRPDPARLRTALALAKRAASAAPRARRAGPLVAAAWLSWALGNSTHAAHYVGLAREVDPDHGLAGIVATMIANHHLPAWVYDRSSAA